MDEPLRQNRVAAGVGEREAPAGGSVPAHLARKPNRLGALAHRPRCGLPQAILLDPSDNGLAVARGLRRRGVRVRVLSVPAYAWVARTPGVEGVTMPGPLDDPGAWLDRLRRIAHDGEGVLIAASDGAGELLARERPWIPSALASFESRASAHLELADKESLYALAARTGVRFPRSHTVSSEAELDDAAAATVYPCVLKPAVSYRWRRLFGDRRVILARDAAELRRAARAPLAAGLKLLVTEFIPGPERNLEAAVTLRRADGSLALAYGRRKLRGYPLRFGAGSLQESIEAVETTGLARRLLEAAGYVGVSSVEVKRHAETGELVLIEVNVRIPQSFALGDASGTDASWRLYATLAGLQLPPQPAQIAGVRSIVPSLEVRAAASLLGRRRLSPRRLFATYRGVSDVSGLDPRDPGPALSFGARHLRDATGALWRRRSARVRSGR